MQFSRFSMIVALNFYNIVLGKEEYKFKLNSSSEDNQKSNSTQETDVDSYSTSSSEVKEGVLVQINNQCLLCCEESPVLEDDSYVVNHSPWFKYFFDNSLKNERTHGFCREIPKCPVCNAEFKRNSRFYLINFVKRLFKNPTKEMADIFQSIIYNYYDIDVLLDEIFISNDILYKNCEDILEWTRNSKYDEAKKLRFSLSRKAEEVKNQKVFAKNFSEFFKNIKSTEDIWKFLNDNFDTIKLLTEFQIRILMESNFSSVSNIDDSEYCKLLYESKFLSDEKIKESVENIDEAYRISIVLLYIGTDKSFDMFIKLNSLIKQVKQYRKIDLFEKFCISYDNSKSNYLKALEILKIMNLLISKVLHNRGKIHSFRLIDYLFERGKKYDDLKKSFEDDFIIDAIMVSLSLNDKNVHDSVHFFFDNNLHLTYEDTAKELVSKISKRRENEDNFYFKEALEYLMKNLHKNNLMKLLDHSMTIELIINCFVFNIGNESLNPLKYFIYDNLFEIATHPKLKGYTHRLFNFVPKKFQTRENDYDIFDLSSCFFLENDENLLKLCDIIKPKNVYYALKTVCSKTTFLNNFSFDDRKMLKELIHVIIREPKKDKLFKIVATRLPKKYHFLIKLYLIDYSVTLARKIKTDKGKEIFKRLKEYIKTNIKNTPTLKEAMISKSLNIFEYLNPENLCREKTGEIETSLKNIKKSEMINLCHELFKSESVVAR